MAKRNWFSADDTTRAPTARGSDPAEVVRDTTPIWQLRGWKREADRRTYAGPYATKFGTWHGHIRATPDAMSVYIYDPPQNLRRHPAWHCFHPRESKWWSIHLAQQPVDPSDVNSVIVYVERLIVESYRLASKR